MAKAKAATSKKNPTTKAPTKGQAKPPVGQDTVASDAPADVPVIENVDVKKSRYLLNARYTHRPFGGVPMPANTHFYGFVTMKVTEKVQGGGITEKQALAAVKTKLKREVLDLTIESVSLLPAKW